MKLAMSAVVLFLALAPALAMGQAASAPARDARGIPVVSNPVPQALMGYSGTNYNATGGLGSAPTPGPGSTPNPMVASYPPCTRTVTDGCVQTYERGRDVRAMRR